MDKQENYIIFIINYGYIANQFLKDKDMRKYNTSCQKLLNSVKRTSDKQTIDFCQNELLNFAPIINEIKEKEIENNGM